MPKPPNAIPSIPLNVALPQDIHARLSLHLYSNLEERVPFGAYKEFFVARIKEFFSTERLDLAPFAGTEPGAFVVSGSPAAMSVLRKTLKEEVPA